MPGYPWLSQALVDPALVEHKMRVLKMLGDPYTDADFASIKDDDLVLRAQLRKAARRRQAGKPPADD
jgi:cbb3-type cytochrome oxidase cytochrome c subunit